MYSMCEEWGTYMDLKAIETFNYWFLKVIVKHISMTER